MLCATRWSNGWSCGSNSHLLLPGLQASAESGEVDETLSVPLLEQNKPPQLPGREKDEMADVELRPESVSLSGTAARCCMRYE